MSEIIFHNKSYSSLGEVHAIPTIQYNRGLEALARRDKPIYPSMVKTQFGFLNFISYRGINLPPSRETFLLAQKTAEIIRECAASFIDPLRIVDVGTGSGLIAVTLATELRDFRKGSENTIIATDISGTILSVAELNSQINGITGIQFRQRDMLQGIKSEFGIIDVIICNPPFYYSNRIPQRIHSANFIPRLSVDGGTDSLEFYRELFSQAADVISDQGFIVVQIQDYKLNQIQEIAKTYMRNASIAKVKPSNKRFTLLVVGNSEVIETVNKLFPQRAKFSLEEQR